MAFPHWSALAVLVLLAMPMQPYPAEAGITLPGQRSPMNRAVGAVPPPPVAAPAPLPPAAAPPAAPWPISPNMAWTNSAPLRAGAEWVAALTAPDWQPEVKFTTTDNRIPRDFKKACAENQPVRVEIRSGDAVYRGDSKGCFPDGVGRYRTRDRDTYGIFTSLGSVPGALKNWDRELTPVPLRTYSHVGDQWRYAEHSLAVVGGKLVDSAPGVRLFHNGEGLYLGTQTGPDTAALDFPNRDRLLLTIKDGVFTAITGMITADGTRITGTAPPPGVTGDPRRTLKWSGPVTVRLAAAKGDYPPGTYVVPESAITGARVNLGGGYPRPDALGQPQRSNPRCRPVAAPPPGWIIWWPGCAGDNAAVFAPDGATVYEKIASGIAITRFDPARPGVKLFMITAPAMAADMVTPAGNAQLIINGKAVYNGQFSGLVPNGAGVCLAPDGKAGEPCVMTAGQRSDDVHLARIELAKAEAEADRQRDIARARAERQAAAARERQRQIDEERRDAMIAQAIMDVGRKVSNQILANQAQTNALQNQIARQNMANGGGSSDWSRSQNVVTSMAALDQARARLEAAQQAANAPPRPGELTQAQKQAIAARVVADRTGSSSAGSGGGGDSSRSGGRSSGNSGGSSGGSSARVLHAKSVFVSGSPPSFPPLKFAAAPRPPPLPAPEISCPRPGNCASQEGNDLTPEAIENRRRVDAYQAALRRADEADKRQRAALDAKRREQAAALAEWVKGEDARRTACSEWGQRCTPD